MRVEISKIDSGYYKFGSRKIHIKSENDNLMVRIGPGEYITLNMFIIENEGIEL